MAHYRTTVILKTDIVDSTPRLAGQTQSEMGLQRQQHRQFISEIAVKNRGGIFQEEGDAYWIEFPSVTDAAFAAMEMHQNLRTMQGGKSEQQRLAIRIVITVGDILHQEKDTLGTTLSLTARIEKVTPPDETFLSHAAWLILNKAEVQTSFVGESYFKGFEESEKIYKLDQKYGIRVFTDQYIVLADAKGFTNFINSSSTEIIEDFLLEYDNLVTDVCAKYGGVIRQVMGDMYFLTFAESGQNISAAEQLCLGWKRILQRYKIGLSVGIHKGILHVFRSYVFGEDINTTELLSQLARFQKPEADQISAVVSSKIRDELQGTNWDGKLRSFDVSKIMDKQLLSLLKTDGAYWFVFED